MSCAPPVNISVVREIEGDDGSLQCDGWDVTSDVTTQQVVDLASLCGDLQARSLELGGARNEIVIWNKEKGFLSGVPEQSFFNLMKILRGDGGAYPSEQKGKYVLIARF